VTRHPYRTPRRPRQWVADLFALALGLAIGLALGFGL